MLDFIYLPNYILRDYYLLKLILKYSSTPFCIKANEQEGGKHLPSPMDDRDNRRRYKRVPCFVTVKKGQEGTGKGVGRLIGTYRYFTGDSVRVQYLLTYLDKLALNDLIPLRQ